MTIGINTCIPWNTLEGAPFDWNNVSDVTSVREDGIVARETTAFEFLRWIIVNTE
jgi:hypothetical protein